MYPREELNDLAARKAVLRVRIFRHRAECAECAATVAQPLVWIDRVRAQWQALPSWIRVAVPVLLAAMGRRRKRAGRRRVLRSLLRWAPVAWRLWRQLQASKPDPSVSWKAPAEPPPSAPASHRAD